MSQDKSQLSIAKVSEPNKSGLIAYNIDGLELFFTANRKVRASQSAIARMCSTPDKEVAQGQIRQLLLKLQNKGEFKMDVVEAQIQAGSRLQGHLLYSSEAIVACLENYNPTRLKDYMRFGIDEGLAQLFCVPVSQPFQQAPAEFVPEVSAWKLVEAYTKLAEAEDKIELMNPIYQAVQLRPNLKKALESSNPSNQLLLAASDELLTGRELIKKFDLDLTPMGISRFLASLWRGEIGLVLNKKRVIKTDKSGRQTAQYALAFPSDWAIEKLNLIK